MARVRAEKKHVDDTAKNTGKNTAQGARSHANTSPENTFVEGMSHGQFKHVFVPTNCLYFFATRHLKHDRGPYSGGTCRCRTHTTAQIVGADLRDAAGDKIVQLGGACYLNETKLIVVHDEGPGSGETCRCAITEGPLLK